jgi:NAD-dependent deacetylase
VLEFYRQRFERLRGCQPNPAHRALARLEDKFHVVHVTQNIDDLLEQGGCTHVIHLHGMLTRRKCEWHRDIVLDPANLGFTCDYKAAQTAAVELGEVCPRCGGQLRPDVVWFGEAVDMREREMIGLLDDVRKNDGVFICVGTSAQVYPAASLVQVFAPARRKFIVDRQPLRVTGYTLVAGPAGETLPPLVEQLLAEEGS